MISAIVNFFRKILKIVRVFKKLYYAEGITTVNIAQINYGSILSGKTVLVTGGSSGIGLAIAKKCVSEGAFVLITGRNGDTLAKAIQEIGSPKVKTLCWDVSNIKAMKTKFSEALELLGGNLDILVNNAGLNTAEDFLSLKEDTWDRVSATNEKGFVFLTQTVCNYWISKTQKGKIINISSKRGFLGVIDGPYGMSKWGMIGLTQGLGVKMYPFGIVVNGIAPGLIGDTGMNLIGREKKIDCSENVYHYTPPSNRVGLPLEIAELAVFLMSDASNYIVGQTILCDGGSTLKV